MWWPDTRRRTRPPRTWLSAIECMRPRAVSLCTDASSLPWFFFFSSRRRHTRLQGDWSSDVCSSDLRPLERLGRGVLFAAGLLHRWARDAKGAQSHTSARRLPPRDLSTEFVHNHVDKIGRASCRERG